MALLARGSTGSQRFILLSVVEGEHPVVDGEHTIDPSIVKLLVVST